MIIAVTCCNSQVRTVCVRMQTPHNSLTGRPHRAEAEAVAAVLYCGFDDHAGFMVYPINVEHSTMLYEPVLKCPAPNCTCIPVSVICCVFSTYYETCHALAALLQHSS